MPGAKPIRSAIPGVAPGPRDGGRAHGESSSDRLACSSAPGRTSRWRSPSRDASAAQTVAPRVQLRRPGYRPAPVRGDTGPVTRDRFSIITDGLPSQLPDIDPSETREWIESLDAADRHRRPATRALPHAQAARTRARAAGRRAGAAQHRLHQHHPARARTLVPGRRGHRAAHPRLHPVERGDHGLAREQDGRRRRPHRHLRQRRVAVRGRLQPLLPRQGPRQPGIRATRSTSRATRRPASTPAPSSRAG